MDSPVEDYGTPLSSSQFGGLYESPAGSMDSLQEFFIDDNGNHMVILPEPTSFGSKSAPSTPKGSRSLSRSMSRASLMSVASAATVGTVVPTYGVIDLSLADVCNYIDDHRSLQQAAIVSSECYSERAGAVTHRFVVLELRRPRRKVIWLRLDRRRGEKVSVMRFLAVSGVTKANDRGMLSATKDLLVGDSFRENTQVFANPPNLAEFSRLLRIITEEIVSYRIWPENCWFFCSLIQQHLEGAQTGWFVNGNLKYATLASDIRIRVSSRVWDGRKTPAAPRRSAAAPSIEVSRPEVSEGDTSADESSVAAAATLPIRRSPSPRQPAQKASSAPLRNVSPPQSSAYDQQVHSLSLPLPGPGASGANGALPGHRRAPSAGSQVPSYASDATSSPPESNVQLPEERGSSPQYPRPHVPYEGPSAELIGKLHDLDDDATVEDDAIKAKVKTALELAPNIAIIDSISKSVRKRASKFIDVIDEIDTFLGNSPEREPDTLIYRAEAVRLQRALYLDTPLSSQGDLARLLRNQALALHRHKRDEEACVLDEEALAIRREGYRVRPSANRARLAGMLHTYSIHLYSIKRLEEALSTNEEAVVLRRLLYEYDPDEYIEPLSSSLENLGVRRGSVQRFEDAKLAEEEALVLRRIMYEKDQDKNRKALADCLHNYSITLDDLGLPKESRAAQAERDALRALMNEGDNHTSSYSASTNASDDEDASDAD